MGYCSRITNEGVEELVNLESLRLIGINFITMEGLVGLTKLRKLNISPQTIVKDDTLEPNLTYLDMCANQNVLGGTHLYNLRHLGLDFNVVIE